MNEVGNAVGHGWAWQAADTEGVASNPGNRIAEITGSDGCRYRKVTYAGMPVAYIRVSAGGGQEFLLPPVEAID